MHIDKQFINIKATTAEKMGFIGREEGIAVQSIATVKYYNWKNK
jgi:2-C-methyl-D-erythritol 4-phosphate cytidylyltransferase / 2-C-methyl-D-erythritol 2,4-cyclodiphosphate synthase